MYYVFTFLQQIMNLENTTGQELDRDFESATDMTDASSAPLLEVKGSVIRKIKSSGAKMPMVNHFEGIGGGH